MNDRAMNSTKPLPTSNNAELRTGYKQKNVGV